MISMQLNLPGDVVKACIKGYLEAAFFVGKKIEVNRVVYEGGSQRDPSDTYKVTIEVEGGEEE